MLDEALLVGTAAIAAVIAGFTAVTAALAPPGGSWSQVHRIRQRAIVSTSFNVVFEALLPVIAFAWFADARQAVVVSSAIVAIQAAWIVVTWGRQLSRAGGLRTWSGRSLYVPGIAALLMFAAYALVFGSVAVYALALCLQLSVAVISFYQLDAAASSWASPPARRCFGWPAGKVAPTPDQTCPGFASPSASPGPGMLP